MERVAFGLLPETYCGKGIYWGEKGILVGHRIPERMFVDWVILFGTGGEDTYGVINVVGDSS